MLSTLCNVVLNAVIYDVNTLAAIGSAVYAVLYCTIHPLYACPIQCSWSLITFYLCPVSFYNVNK